MKLKTKQLSLMKLLKVFKGILFLSVVLLTNSLSAQTIAITSLDSGAAEVASGDPQDLATFTIAQTGVSFVNPIIVEYAISGTAAGSDYTTSGTGSVTLSSTAPSASVTIDTITDDQIVEDDETIIITITSIDGVAVASGDSVTIEIADNDVGIVSLDTSSSRFIATVDEDGTFGQFSIDIDKVNGTSEDLTVTYEIDVTSASSAVQTVDYDLTNAVALTFANNSAQKLRYIRAAPIDDTDVEGDETVVITLLSTDNPSYTIDLANNTATITIVDDECAAGASAPILNNDPTTFCDPTGGVNLNTFVSATDPVGSSLQWSLIASPTESDLLTTAEVTAADSNTYYGVYTAGTGANFCVSPSSVALKILISTAPDPGTAVTGLIRCNDSGFGSSTINLNNAISNGDTGGTWAYVSGGTADPVINTNDVVNFNGDDADTYVFEYTLTGTAPCADSSVKVLIVAEACDPCTAYDTAPVLNTNDTTFCDEDTVSLDTFIDNTGPSNSLVRWSLNANPDEDDLLSTVAAAVATSDTYYAVFASGTDATYCSSPVSDPLIINLYTTPSAGADANGAACSNSDDTFGATLLDLDDLLSTGADSGDWELVAGPEQLAPNANNAVEFSGKLEGVYEYKFTTNTAEAPCENDTADFTIIVSDCDPCVAGNSAPTLNVTKATDFCGPITNTLDEYVTGGAGSAPVGTELKWATSELISPIVEADFVLDNRVASPLSGGYFAYYFDAVNGCVSPPLEIILLSKIIPVLSDVEGAERCDIGTVVLTASGIAGDDNATINWYAAETGGGIIGTGSSFTTPVNSTTTSYYAEASFNDCVSERQQAIAKIVEQPSAGVAQNNGNASACNVVANGPTILDLDDLISGEDAGSWVFTSGPTSSFTILSNNILNFQGQPDGEYVFTYTTIGAETPCTDASTVMTITVNDCDVDTDLDGLFDGVEATLGTNPLEVDTDGDGINDSEEIGPDSSNPLDEDGDGTIDAIESNILDTDGDTVVDQIDSANENPCVPSRVNGVCDFDLDDVPDINDPEPDNPCVPNINNANCDPDPVDLEITKTVDNINASIDDEITFTVTVKNLDTDATSSTIQIKEELEDAFEYISHETSTGIYDIQAGEWDILEIEPLASHTLNITVKILEADSYENTAELIASFPADEVVDNNRSNVTLPILLPDGINLILEKTVSLGVGKDRLESVTGLISGVDEDLEVIYYLKVINASQQDVVSNIVVSDIFTNEDNVVFEIIESTVPLGSAFDEDSQVWVIEDDLVVGGEIELSYRVSFKSMGTIINSAVIESSTPRESLLVDADSEASATVAITTRNEVEVGILYNQFSPNGDGLNDVLNINIFRKNEDDTEDIVELIYNVQIFNRYGNMVYEASGQKDAEVWDGSWNGKDSPDGTYFYTMNIQVSGEDPKIQKGWIQLIR